MSKYIDADRLKAEIEKHIKEVKDAEKRFTPNMGFFDAKLSGIYDVMALIDSLQQEQEQYVIGGQVFGATDVDQLYEGKVYIISNLVQDTEFGLSVRDKVEMLLIKD